VPESLADRARLELEKLLAFIDIFVESLRMDEVVEAIRRVKGVKKVFEVTGEFDVVVMVEADGMEELREVLKNGIMKIHGVKSTVTDIALKTHEPYSDFRPG
jgi:DNA-binding Lrp family transcriptional regulator